MKFTTIFLKTTTAIFLIYFLLFISIGFIANYYFSTLSTKTFDISETIIEIPYGSSLRRVSEILSEAHIVSQPVQFYWYLRIGRRDGLKMQAGYYRFMGAISYRDIAERLLNGRDPSFKTTFKEGQTLVELADTLEKNGLITKEQLIDAMKQKDIIEMVGARNASLRQALLNDVGGIEGYLFPDTYFFSKRDNAESIIKKMHQRLLKKIDDEMWARIAQLKTSLHDVLTLASIVEKETSLASERPIIASVYYNRLRLGMRLQADPTVIYGMKNYAGKIKKTDLLTYHSYNTYKITGLPPGPISSVGIEAIRAVLWPAETDYLYFVSRNDGSHEFCPDLPCHSEAVRIWQIDFFRKAERYPHNRQ